MTRIVKPRLDPKKRYLQVALNGTLDDAWAVISSLPASDRIIVEAGTPLIKRYGEAGIRQVYEWWSARISGTPAMPAAVAGGSISLLQAIREISKAAQMANASKVAAPSASPIRPYVVADLKTMDRAETEVEMAARAGASAAVALGIAPLETLDAFVYACEQRGLDAMIDMMNVEYPLAVLNKLKKVPPVVIIHRGVDEERLNKEKQIPLHEIRRIKGAYDVMLSIAGGDTVREVQRSIFNDADIVVIWKSVFQSTAETATLVSEFLQEIK